VILFAAMVGINFNSPELPISKGFQRFCSPEALFFMSVFNFSATLPLRI